MKHSHYRKDVSHLSTIDVYRVCDLFGVEDPSGAIQHAIKKILMPGSRGVKSKRQDLLEAVDSLTRKIEMMDEDERPEMAEQFGQKNMMEWPDENSPRQQLIEQGGEMAEAVYPALDALGELQQSLEDLREA